MIDESTPPIRLLLFGASSGIGRCLLATALDDGAIVGATTHRSPIMSPESHKLLRITCDVRRADEINQAVEAFTSFATAVDIAIYLPGIMTPKLHTYTQQEDIEEQVNVNLKGGMLMSRAVLPRMIRQGRGKIVFTSSASVGHVTAGTCIYSSTKAALENFSHCLSREYAKCNIEAFSIRLPPTATKMINDIPAQKLAYLSSDGSPVQIANPKLVARKIWSVVRQPNIVNEAAVLDFSKEDIYE